MVESKEPLVFPDYPLRFEDDPDPGQVFREKAELELRETSENRQKALQELVQLLKNEEDLNVPTHEAYLLAYLRPCKFYPESAFHKLTTLFKFKSKYPKFCSNLIPSLEKNVFQHDLLTVLPHRDQHGRRMLLIEAGKKWNTKEVSLTELIRAVMLVVDAAILEPKTQIAGAVVIVDMEGLSMQHVWQFSPNIAKMLLDWIQESMPCRIKGVHIVNQPYIFNMLFAIFKPFIQEKLRNRINFHGEDRSSLIEHIDAKFIPTQYGGDMEFKTEHGAKLHQLLSQYNETYEEAATFGYRKKGKAGKSKH